MGGSARWGSTRCAVIWLLDPRLLDFSSYLGGILLGPQDTFGAMLGGIELFNHRLHCFQLSLLLLSNGGSLARVKPFEETLQASSPGLSDLLRFTRLGQKTRYASGPGSTVKAHCMVGSAPYSVRIMDHGTIAMLLPNWMPSEVYAWLADGTMKPAVLNNHGAMLAAELSAPLVPDMAMLYIKLFSFGVDGKRLFDKLVLLTVN